MMKNSATTVLPATEPVFVYNTQFNSYWINIYVLQSVAGLDESNKRLSLLLPPAEGHGIPAGTLRFLPPSK